MRCKISWLPDSKPTSSTRRPLSRSVLRRIVVDVCARVASPAQVEPLHVLAERDRVLFFAGQRVVVEHVFRDAIAEDALGLIEIAAEGLGSLVEELVSADRVRPEAERALRNAAAAGVPRDVRMQQVAIIVLADVEKFVVRREHARHRIPIGDVGALGVLHDRSVRIAVGQPDDRVPRPAFRKLQARVVEVVATDEVDHRVQLERLLRQHRDVRADEPDLRVRIRLFDAARALDVVGQRRGARVHDDQVVPGSNFQDVVRAEAVRRRIHQGAPRDEGRRLGQPGRIPERRDLAFRLITRSRTAVEDDERRRAQKHSLHATRLRAMV